MPLHSATQCVTMAGNAVQRWYVYSTGPVEFEKCIIIPESPPQKWVRDEDANELERVISEQSQRIIALRDDLAGVRQINRLQAEALADERHLIRQYKAELARLRAPRDPMWSATMVDNAVR